MKEPQTRERRSLFGRRKPVAADAPGAQPDTATAEIDGNAEFPAQILDLDPARVRIWPGNARIYAALSVESCRELIASIEETGGQQIPAVVRPIDDDAEHDFEVIAGSRRHFAISWLRQNRALPLPFRAVVQSLDDEGAFRLSDLENRARRDVSDIERARNYADALQNLYEGHLTLMATRLAVSKGWLSKMIRIAAIPDDVIQAFGSRDDLRVKPAYALALAMEGPSARAAILATARQIARAQIARREEQLAPYSAAEVIKLLLDATAASDDRPERIRHTGPTGTAALSVLDSNQRSITLRIHAKSGTARSDLVAAIEQVLAEAEANGLTL